MALFTKDELSRMFGNASKSTRKAVPTPTYVPTPTVGGGVQTPPPYSTAPQSQDPQTWGSSLDDALTSWSNTEPWYLGGGGIYTGGKNLLAKVASNPFVGSQLNMLGVPFNLSTDVVANKLDPTNMHSDLSTIFSNQNNNFKSGIHDYLVAHPNIKSLKDLASITTLAELTNAGLSGYNERARPAIDVTKGIFARSAMAAGATPQQGVAQANEAVRQNPNLYGTAANAYSLIFDPMNAVAGPEELASKLAASATKKATLKGLAKRGIKASGKDIVQKAPDLVEQSVMDRYKNSPLNKPAAPQPVALSHSEVMDRINRAEMFARQQAQRQGLTPAQTEDFVAKTRQEVANRITAQMPNTEQAKSLIERLAQKEKQKFITDVQNVSKTAQKRGKDAVIGLSIPFTNYALPIGKIERKIPTVGATGAAIVNKMTRDLRPSYGKTPQQRMEAILSSRYGKINPEDLTHQELSDLQSYLMKPSNDINIEVDPKSPIPTKYHMEETPFDLEKLLEKGNYDEQTKQVARQLVRQGATPEELVQSLPALLRGQSQTFAENAAKHIKPNDILKKLDEALYYANRAGQNVSFDQVLPHVIDEYNADPQKIADALDDIIRGHKQTLADEQARMEARHEAERQAVEQRNRQAQANYEQAVAEYNAAKDALPAQRKALKEQAEKARDEKYASEKAVYDQQRKALREQAEAQAKREKEEKTRKAEEEKKAKRAEGRRKALATAQEKETKKAQPAQPTQPTEPKATKPPEAKKPAVPEKKPDSKPAVVLPKEVADVKDEYVHYATIKGVKNGLNEAVAKSGAESEIDNLYKDLTKKRQTTEEIVKVIQKRIENVLSNDKMFKMVEGERELKDIYKKLVADGLSEELVDPIVNLATRKALKKASTDLYMIEKPIRVNAEKAGKAPKLPKDRDVQFQNFFLDARKQFIEQLAKEARQSDKSIEDLIKQYAKEAEAIPIGVHEHYGELQNASLKKYGNSAYTTKMVKALADDVKPYRTVEAPKPKPKPQTVDKKLEEDLKPKPPQEKPSEPKEEAKPPVVKEEKSKPPAQEKPKRTRKKKETPQVETPVDKKLGDDLDRYSKPIELEKMPTPEEVRGMSIDELRKLSDDVYNKAMLKILEKYKLENFSDIDKIADKKLQNKILHDVFDTKENLRKNDVYQQEIDRQRSELNNRLNQRSEKSSENPKKDVKSEDKKEPVKEELPLDEKINQDLKPKFKRGEGLKFKVPEKPVKEAETPAWAKDHANAVGGEVTHRSGDVALVRGYNMLGDPVFTVGRKDGYRTTVDIESNSFPSNFISSEQKAELVAAKKKWLKEDAEAFAKNPDGPFKKGENFAASPNVPSEVQEIIKQWQSMMGISERIYLTTIEDAKVANYHGVFSAIPSQSLNSLEFGSKRRLKNGDFVIAYKPDARMSRTLETISHEMGHVLMDTRYAQASPEIKEAINADFEKWLISTKGKTEKELVDSLRAHTTAKLTGASESEMADQMVPYWRSRSEWFADQVSRWATTSEKPLSVVEKFFSRLANVMKQFFAKNKQYLPSKTMKDWLDGLEESAKTNIQPSNQIFDSGLQESRSRADEIFSDLKEKQGLKAPKKGVLETPKLETPVQPKKPVLEKEPPAPKFRIEATPAELKQIAAVRDGAMPLDKKFKEMMDKKISSQLDKLAKQVEQSAPYTRKSVKVLDHEGNPIRTEVRAKMIPVSEAKPIVFPERKGINGEVIPEHVIQPVVITKTKSRLNVAKILQDGRFVNDAMHDTRIGHILRNNAFYKFFDPRAIKTKDEFLKKYGDLLQNTKNRVIGENNYYGRSLVNIQKMARNLTESEMHDIQYLLENRFPEAYTNDQKLAIKGNEKLQAVANEIRSLLREIGHEDQSAGLFKALRQDYFPHKLSDEYMGERADEIRKDLASDPDLKHLMGQSSKAGHGKQRIGLPTLAQVDDAIVKLRNKQIELEAKGVDTESISKKIDNLGKMYNRNTMDVLGKHVFDSVRARAFNDLQKQMIADGILTADRSAEKYVRIPEEARAYLGLKDTDIKYIHPEMLEQLNKAKNLFTDQGLQTWFDNWTKVTNVWRYATYLLLPKHYLVDLMGNMFNNMMAGISPDAYKDAMGILTRFSKGKATAQEQALMKEAFRNAVVGQGVVTQFRNLSENQAVKQARKEGKMAKLTDVIAKSAKAVSNSKIARPAKAYATVLQSLGELADDWTRLAHYIHVRKTTGSADLAASSVRKYLFNYHEMNNAAKFFRAFAPFLMWLKNNIPLQIESLLQNPKYIYNLEKIRQMTFDGDQKFERRPDYEYERGWRIFGHTYQISLPYSDLYMANEDPVKTLRNVYGQVNPLITTPIDITANQDVSTGSTIDKNVYRMRRPMATDKMLEHMAKKLGGFAGRQAVKASNNMEKGESANKQLANILQSWLSPAGAPMPEVP